MLAILFNSFTHWNVAIASSWPLFVQYMSLLKLSVSFFNYCYCCKNLGGKRKRTKLASHMILVLADDFTLHFPHCSTHVQSQAIECKRKVFGIVFQWAVTKPPDLTLHNFRASRSDNQQISCSSKTPITGFRVSEIVKLLVRQIGEPKKLCDELSRLVCSKR